MTKIRVLFMLIGFSQIIQGQSLSSDIFWLATESEHIGKKGMISPLDGFAFNFGRKKSNITHVFSDSIATVTYNVKKKKIKWNGELFGKIIHQDKDSLILMVDKNMRVKFVPLWPEEKHEIKANFWNHTDWTFRNEDFVQHFRLLGDPWNWKSNEPPKICLITTVGKNFKNSHTEKWNFKIIGGSHLFTKTYGQMEKDIYRIQKYLEDSVILKSLSYHPRPVELKLIKIPTISEIDRNKITRQIRNYKWTGVELLKKASSFDEEETDEFEISGFYAMDTISFQKKSLTDKSLSFKFLENSDYEIYESDTLRLSGKWRISDTGQQIILDGGFIKEDYIDLIEIQSDNLIIGKIDRFQVGNRKRDYIEYYYQLKLQK